MATTIISSAHPEAPKTLVAAPYLEAVQRYARRDAGRFHVPGHKGGSGAGKQLAGALGDALALDVPSCIEGIDLGHGETPLQAAQRSAAATWGARRTWFLVNGASEASHAICLALGRPGAKVVVQRNVHASTIHGLVLGGLRPTFVMPGVDHALGIAHCVRPDDLAGALDDTPGATAAFVVSPTYFGATADVRGLARVCHERGVVLVVDEAWGAHLRFAARLPEDALAAGADVVISGTHKLIGSLTQSAMLHLGSRSWPQLDEAAISRALALVRTTSPSSLLLASLDGARAHVDARGEALLDAALAQMQEVKRRLRDDLGLGVLGDELVGSHGVAGFDSLRLAIDVGPTGLDGHVVAADLLRLADINLELVTSRVLIAHVGIAEPVLAGGRRLICALRQVLGRPGSWPAGDAPPPAQAACFGEAVMSPRDAFFAEHEAVALADAAGRISADSIAVYPPGIANLLPGERITARLVRYLLEMSLRGCPLRGTWDEAARSVRVLGRP
jgi:arginine decarboxylase